MLHRKDILRKVPLVAGILGALRDNRLTRSWDLKNKSGHPHTIKQKAVKEYASKYDLQILVETGTCLGEMVYAVKDSFHTIYSIELDRELYEGAQRLFNKCGYIHILQGNSAVILPQVLANLHQPALFWLDAHFSGGNTAKGEVDSPISDEIESILRHPVQGHVILIDDARHFIDQNGYPSIEKLKKAVLEIWYNASIEVSDDIIRIVQNK